MGRCGSTPAGGANASHTRIQPFWCNPFNPLIARLSSSCSCTACLRLPPGLALALALTLALALRGEPRGTARACRLVSPAPACLCCAPHVSGRALRDSTPSARPQTLSWRESVTGTTTDDDSAPFVPCSSCCLHPSPAHSWPCRQIQKGHLRT